MVEPPRLNDIDFGKLTEHIQGSLEQMEMLPYPKVQEDVFTLLNSLDHLHREALTRLVELIETSAPQIKTRMADDLAIQTLMMLYNFVPPEDVPVVPPPSNGGMMIGLNDIAVMPPVAAIQPIWIPADTLDNIPQGTMKAYQLEGNSIVICRPHDDEKLYALNNACLDSILTLDRGHLDGHTLHCPWHACQYDIRTGEIQNDSGLKLTTYPVSVSAGNRIRVGFNIPEWMQ